MSTAIDFPVEAADRLKGGRFRTAIYDGGRRLIEKPVEWKVEDPRDSGELQGGHPANSSLDLRQGTPVKTHRIGERLLGEPSRIPAESDPFAQLRLRLDHCAK